MAKVKKFEFEKFNTQQENVVTTPLNTQNIVQNIVIDSGPATKVTFDCPNELVETMKDFGYWEGMSQKEIIIEALNTFFEGKKIKERPEKVKNRKKVGRKPKALKVFLG